MDPYYDLGGFGRPVTSASTEAQLWFDRGFAWCYGYHHEEAIACFERAVQHDPDCAMAHWGIAYAVGPNYNKPWAAFDADDRRQSAERARSAAAAALAAKAASPVERALIEALQRRLPDADAEDFSPWHDAYADAMRGELDDALPYDEPWGWMQPTRHALGALLLEQGHIEEAEQVYRADLGLDGSLARACQHPDNVWGLHGLHECLARRGEETERRLIRQRLDLAAARADVPVKSSCFCRLEHAA